MIAGVHKTTHEDQVNSGEKYRILARTDVTGM
jgi:hypothetical protein